MANQARHRKASVEALAPRSWGVSLSWAAAVIGLALVASATINPLFGRSVHWDWMAGIAPVAFATPSLRLR